MFDFSAGKHEVPPIPIDIFYTGKAFYGYVQEHRNGNYLVNEGKYGKHESTGISVNALTYYAC